MCKIWDYRSKYCLIRIVIKSWITNKSTCLVHTCCTLQAVRLGLACLPFVQVDKFSITAIQSNLSRRNQPERILLKSRYFNIAILARNSVAIKIYSRYCPHTLHQHLISSHLPWKHQKNSVIMRTIIPASKTNLFRKIWIRITCITEREWSFLRLLKTR